MAREYGTILVTAIRDNWSKSGRKLTCCRIKNDWTCSTMCLLYRTVWITCGKMVSDDTLCAIVLLVDLLYVVSHTISSCGYTYTKVTCYQEFAPHQVDAEGSKYCSGYP